MTADQDAINYEKTIVAGLAQPEGADKETVREYTDRLHYFIQHVPRDQLTKEHQALISCMEQYLDKSGGLGLLDDQALLDMLIYNKAPTEIQVKYTEMFAEYQRTQVSPAKFRYAITRFLEVKEEQRYLNALNETFLILTSELETGNGRTKKKLKGYRDSKQYLLERLNQIEYAGNSSVSPEGDIRQDALAFLEQAKARKEAPNNFRGVTSGIPAIDDLMNGAQPGEFIVVGAYAEAGKTFFLMNWAYNAVTTQARNVVVFTTEVPRAQYSARTYVRHCRNQQFGLPQGIDANALKHGRLSPQELQSIENAMTDFMSNPNYGIFDVVQLPPASNFSYIENKTNAINAQWADRGGVHLVIIDSLNQVAPSMKVDASQTRLGLNDMVRRTKQFAVGFNKGRGVPVIASWHANRKSWEQALKDGKYTLSSWSESDEIERSADMLMWLLKAANSNDTHEILSGIEKYRAGVGQKQFTLYEDFASSYMGSVAVASAQQSQPQSPQTGVGSQKPTFDPNMEGLF